MFWKEADGYRERISVNGAIKKIKKRAKGRKIRLTTNPYNALVIRVDFYGGSEKYPEFETIWLEGLTSETESKILGRIKGEKYSGRYW